MNVADLMGQSHEPTWECVAIPAQGDPVDITGALVDARLTVDASSWPRHRFAATVGDPDLFPVDESSLLMPAGTRLVVSTGVRLPDGQTQWWRQSTVWPDQVTVTRSRLSGAQVEAWSVERRVSQAGFWQGDMSVGSGWTVPGAIRAVLDRTIGPEVEFVDDAGSTFPVPAGLGLSGDPWSAVEALARLAALDVWVDDAGVVRLDQKPVLGALPAVTLATGEGGVVAETQATVERASAANRARVVFRSSAPAVPDVVGVAVLTSGPMRWDGPVGRLLWTDTRDGPVTQGQANQAAAVALNARAGWLRPTVVLCAPDPRVVPGMTVDIRFLSGQVERHVVVAVDRELLPVGAMRVTTRGDYLIVEGERV